MCWCSTRWVYCCIAVLPHCPAAGCAVGGEVRYLPAASPTHTWCRLQGPKAELKKLLAEEGLLGGDSGWNVTGLSWRESDWINTVIYQACEWLAG